jgi:hypothetical protein
MSSEDARAEGVAPVALSPLVRWALGLSAALLALQGFVTLAVYLQVATLDVEAAVRLYGASEVPSGEAAVWRMGVYDRSSARSRPWSRATIDIDGSPVGLTPEPDPRDPARFRIAGGEPATSVVLVARVDAEGLDDRSVEVRLPVVRPRAWLGVPSRASTIERRSGELTQGADPPGVRPPPADPCSVRTHLVPASGVAPVDLETTFHVRFSDGDGAPLARWEVSIDGPGVEGRRRVTDALGVLHWSAPVEWTSDWHLSFDCDGESIQRTWRVTPSWDGVGLSLSRPTAVAGQPILLSERHQRSSGTIHRDVVCDGVRVGAESAPLQRGVQRVDLPAPPSTVPVRWCQVQSYIFLLSHDPPRATQNVLVRQPNVTEREALAEMVRAVASSAPEAVRTHLGPATLDALAVADDGSVIRFGLWLLSALPAPFVPWTIAWDDRESSGAEMRARKDRVQRGAVALLGVDVLLLLGLLLAASAAAALRDRRARALVRRALGDEDMLDDPEERAAAERDRHRGLVLHIGSLLLGVLVVLTCVLALGALLYLVR